jgi:hypothetical protein
MLDGGDEAAWIAVGRRVEVVADRGVNATRCSAASNVLCPCGPYQPLVSWVLGQDTARKNSAQ